MFVYPLFPQLASVDIHPPPRYRASFSLAGVSEEGTGSPTSNSSSLRNSQWLDKTLNFRRLHHGISPFIQFQRSTQSTLLPNNHQDKPLCVHVGGAHGQNAGRVACWNTFHHQHLSFAHKPHRINTVGTTAGRICVLHIPTVHTSIPYTV